MNKFRMTAENLIGVIVFFFVVLGSFVRMVGALDYVDDLIVVRLVQIILVLVITYVALAFLNFQPYNT